MTLQDAIDVFTELALAQTHKSNDLYEKLCSTFSKDLIDKVKSEIEIKKRYDENQKRMNEQIEKMRMEQPNNVCSVV